MNTKFFQHNTLLLILVSLFGFSLEINAQQSRMYSDDFYMSSYVKNDSVYVEITGLSNVYSSRVPHCAWKPVDNSIQTICIGVFDRDHFYYIDDLVCLKDTTLKYQYKIEETAKELNISLGLLVARNTDQRFYDTYHLYKESKYENLYNWVQFPLCTNDK